MKVSKVCLIFRKHSLVTYYKIYLCLTTFKLLFSACGIHRWRWCGEQLICFGSKRLSQPFFYCAKSKNKQEKTNFYIHRFSHAWNCDVRSLKHHLETKKGKQRQKFVKTQCDKNSYGNLTSFLLLKKKDRCTFLAAYQYTFWISWCWMIILLKNYLVMNLIIWKDFKKNKQV